MQIKRRNIQKKSKTSKHKYNHKGGAIYSFDLTDKIGGMPAYLPLNGTKDGDCPASDTKDLGFTNYGMTRGGARKRHSKKHSAKKHSAKKHSAKKHSAKKHLRSKKRSTSRKH
jgi:hypothetical protein